MQLNSSQIKFAILITITGILTAVNIIINLTPTEYQAQSAQYNPQSTPTPLCLNKLDQNELTQNSTGSDCLFMGCSDIF